MMDRVDYSLPKPTNQRRLVVQKCERSELYLLLFPPKNFLGYKINLVVLNRMRFGVEKRSVKRSKTFL